MPIFLREKSPSTNQTPPNSSPKFHLTVKFHPSELDQHFCATFYLQDFCLYTNFYLHEAHKS